MPFGDRTPKMHPRRAENEDARLPEWTRADYCCLDFGRAEAGPDRPAMPGAGILHCGFDCESREDDARRSMRSGPRR
jgi:hypothetical protein